jgi:cytochrome c-type biogenesis protein CcmH
MKRSILFRMRASLIPVMLYAITALGAENRQDAKMAREIEDNLIAPCCWSQPVSQHYSEASEKIRKEVREMVAAGKSRDEILDYFVSQYGERILAAPRARGFNALAYVLPWAGLILGAGLLIVILRKLRSPVAVSGPPPLPDARYASIVDKEVKDLDE